MFVKTLDMWIIVNNLQHIDCVFELRTLHITITLQNEIYVHVRKKIPSILEGI